MTNTLHIAIEPFKRSKYDRGSKKILVDGEEWGWIEMITHGCHGPSYHAHDMHGPVYSRTRSIGTRKGDPVEDSFRPISAKANRRENIGRPESEHVKRPSTEEQLRAHVAQLIEDGHLRSPAVREQEIKLRADSHRNERIAREEQEQIEFHQKATASIPPGLNLIEHIGETAHALLVNNIIDAMRWAQTK